MKTKKSNALPALALAFSMAALSGCSSDNTHNCVGGQGQKVDIEWGKYYAEAKVTETNGNEYTVNTWNRFMLAEQHVNDLGGTCAQWQPRQN